MAILKITIDQFLELAKNNPVLDVRSPGEYTHAHIPNAYSIPLFTDEERKVVGTAYKQESRQTAIKIGLDYFGVKMRSMVEEVEDIISRFSLGSSDNKIIAGFPLGSSSEKEHSVNSINDSKKMVLVHCWRGGMRSAGVAWLLDLYGVKVYTLVGGYKAYRKWVRDQFEKRVSFNVIGGFTGSGKTPALKLMQQQGDCIIDLEGLASHKGSAFGAMGEKPQPTQEMFENLLAKSLADVDDILKNETKYCWIEDESQRIGQLKIPDPFWKQMRDRKVLFIDIPFEERLDYLTAEYGKFEKEKLVNAIIRIQKRLGGLDTKTAIGFLIEDNHKECFRILLKYYDKWYGKGLYNRENIKDQLNKISCDKVDPVLIAGLLSKEMKATK